ncbi:hypothetical protein L7F22_031524 [Adiantum nelumboides]|nr:hypothetical protein [Adiantum nelumboides]
MVRVRALATYDDEDYKFASWLALICCAQSLANMRDFENDLKQIVMAMTFALMGIVTNYLGPARQALRPS